MEEKRHIREKIIKGLELYQQRLVQTKKERNLKMVVSDEKGNVVQVAAEDL